MVSVCTSSACDDAAVLGALRRRAGRMGAGVVVAAFAWWATGLAPFSGASTAAVLGAGSAAVALGARRRRRGHPDRVPTGGVIVWALLLGALALWQLGAFLARPRHEHPTLSALANDALDARPARAIAFAAWLAGAAWLAR